MRIAVIGAGAVGGLIGGLLAEAGEDVTLIGRASQVEAIRNEGLRITGTIGERVTWPDAQENLSEEVDLTILATKTQDLDAACREAAQFSRGAVVTMQNGTRCDEIARRYFAPERIVGCVVYSMATFLKPGEIECGVRGWLTLGTPFVKDPNLLQQVEHTLEKAMRVRTSSDIAASRWTKLIGNLNNALPAATGLPLQEIYFSPSTSRLPLRVMGEGLRTLTAAGIRLDRSPQAAAMRLASRLPEPVPVRLFKALARTKIGKVPMLGSTWQSVMRGSATEIDYLNGEIVALGERTGSPTPYNSRVVQLVHEVERTREFYPPEKLWPV